jgi:hypothetical protein
LQETVNRALTMIFNYNFAALRRPCDARNDAKVNIKDMFTSRAGPRGLGGELVQGLDDAVHDFLDQDFIVALAHHPNDRLGAGRTHD